MPKNQAEDKGSNFVYRMVKANQIESKTKENLNYSKFSSNNKTTSNSNNKINSSMTQSSMSGKKRKCKGEKINCCYYFK